MCGGDHSVGSQGGVCGDSDEVNRINSVYAGCGYSYYYRDYYNSEKGYSYYWESRILVNGTADAFNSKDTGYKYACPYGFYTHQSTGGDIMYYYLAPCKRAQYPDTDRTLRCPKYATPTNEVWGEGRPKSLPLYSVGETHTLSTHV